MNSDIVSTLSCCRIGMDSLMIIVPKLRSWTFRYWAVRATDVRDNGSRPTGGRHNASADFHPKPITTQLLSKHASLAIFKMPPQRKPQAKKCMSYVLILTPMKESEKNGIGHHILLLNAIIQTCALKQHELGGGPVVQIREENGDKGTWPAGTKAIGPE
jgi:hypothetical protein